MKRGAHPAAVCVSALGLACAGLALAAAAPHGPWSSSAAATTKGPMPKAGWFLEDTLP